MRERCGGRLGEEPGFAVPTVMAATIAALVLAGAAVTASVNSQRATVRDHDAKRALAAAETGVDQALLAFNRKTRSCAIGVWCSVPAQSVAGLTGATYAYSVHRPNETELEVVSTGNADGITRRVDVVARSSGGLQPFTDASLIGLNYIRVESQASVWASMATNGDVTQRSSSELHCDFVKVGVGRRVVPQGGNVVYDCPTAIQGVTSLPPVNQGDVATNNSNGRFFDNVTYTGSAPSWNAGTRQMSMSANSTLTLPSGNYSFCTLTMSSNTSLYVPAGATVRIYFDSPEACGLPDNAVQLSMQSNARISPTSGTPTDLALLFVGSATLNTRIELASNTQVPDGACEQNFVVYAPRSEITMASNSTFCGAMAGKHVLMNANSRVNANDAASNYQLPNTVEPHYYAEDFIECSTAGASPPDAGC